MVGIIVVVFSGIFSRPLFECFAVADIDALCLYEYECVTIFLQVCNALAVVYIAIC